MEHIPRFLAMRDWIVPRWPAPSNVKALFTTRNGGVGQGSYATLNLGDHVGDDPETVSANRMLLREILPSEPKWLKQVHGKDVLNADHDDCVIPCPADASFSSRPGSVCAVLVADCLPILMCDHEGTLVAAIHAGWRGLATGVIEQAVSEMRGSSHANPRLMAWLGPAIGPAHFEVGDEVREAFMARDKLSARAFHRHGGLQTAKWLADLFLLARLTLNRTGITEIYGGEECTFSNPERFFSYRRDGRTGRMAGLIWFT
jgi:YfiH family protein